MESAEKEKVNATNVIRAGQASDAISKKIVLISIAKKNRPINYLKIN